MAKNDIIIYDSDGSKKTKKPMNWKRLILNACIILGVGLAYFLLPIDIVPDPATGAYGAGMYDDIIVNIACIIGAIVSVIVDINKIKKGK